MVDSPIYTPTPADQNFTLPPGVTPTPDNDPFYPFPNYTSWADAHEYNNSQGSLLPPPTSPNGTDSLEGPSSVRRSVGRDVNARELWTQIIARMQAAEGKVTSRSYGTPGLKKRRNPRKDINHSKSPSPNH